jgi:peptidoglycan hydrolase-like protein with peptidoglycan-binding domain
MEGTEGRPKGQLLARRIATAFVCGLIITAAAAIAQAHDQPAQWRDGHAIGDCGIRPSRYVRHLQSILWAARNLSTQGDVDGIFGPVTKDAVRSFQGNHGLSVDGCTGYNTWNKMQNGTHYDSRRQVNLPHMTFVSSRCCPYQETWRFREWSYDRRVRFDKVDANCWMIVNLVHEGNGNTLTLNAIVNHDGHNHCHI